VVGAVQTTCRCLPCESEMPIRACRSPSNRLARQHTRTRVLASTRCATRTALSTTTATTIAIASQGFRMIPDQESEIESEIAITNEPSVRAPAQRTTTTPTSEYLLRPRVQPVTTK